MKGDGELNDAKAWPEVPARYRGCGDDRSAKLLSNLVKFRAGERL